MTTANPTFDLISTEEVEGMKVCDQAGNDIGEIDYLMIDRTSGSVRYAVMSFGGFLGLGRDHYPLPWDSIRYDSNRDVYVANVTEQQLKDAPPFNESTLSDRDWESRWHGHFGARPYWEEGAGSENRRSI
jgi:hypothetical protein